eukprot:1166091-Pyramimonas_sp.AAC.1
MHAAARLAPPRSGSRCPAHCPRGCSPTPRPPSRRPPASRTALGAGPSGPRPSPPTARWQRRSPRIPRPKHPACTPTGSTSPSGRPRTAGAGRPATQARP